MRGEAKVAMDVIWRRLAMAALLAACTPGFGRPLKVAVIPPVDRTDVRAMLESFARSLGFIVEALGPEQVIDPKAFSARRYQAAVYAGNERYLYQVREPGDAVSALMRYLAGGGTLIVAGRCWPFYRPCRWDGADFVRYQGPLPTYHGPRDPWLEQQMERLRQNPTGTFNRFLGLNIAGEGTEQFERPPEGEELEFVVTEAGRRLFPSLPQRFPFPASGDLRFRPASGRNLGEGVRYTAVATLVGSSGRRYGDGICVIEHTSGRLAGGAVVYIWGTLIQGELGRRVLIDALRIAARRAGVAAEGPVRQAQRVQAQLRALLERARKLRALPERAYFPRLAEALAAEAQLAQTAAELGNAARAQALLADVSAAVGLLARRVSAAE